MSKRYKISTIIPVYNVEEYLEETILSIVNQTIGFENIQMILVNDGSPDNSEEICLKYQELYPDNVLYIKQKNAGVSAARNNGFKQATGEFINFIDSDDKFSLNAYKVGYEMLKENNLDVVCYRIVYFDAKNEPLYNDYKFDGTNRVVDLTKEPQYSLYHITSALFKRELVKDIEFDTRVKISEDVKYGCDALVRTKKIGIISTEKYLYRRRQSETSAIQTSYKKPTFYWDTPELSYKYILDLGKKYKDMNDYLQFTIAYDLRFRISEPRMYILTEEEKKKYIESIRDLLKRCDNRIIGLLSKFLELRFLRQLDYKYGEPIYKRVDIKNGYLRLDKENICEMDDLSFDIYNLFIKDSKLFINSRIEFCLNNNFNLYYKIDDKFYKFEKRLIRENSPSLFSDDYDYKVSYFDAEIKLNKNIKRIEFYIEINGEKCQIKPNYIKASKLNELKNSYFKCGKYTVTHDEKCIFINDGKKFKLFKYMLELYKKKEILTLGIIGLYYLTYLFISSNNWIIADRDDCAGDNGEELLKHIKNNKLKKNVFFGLNKNSKDVDRISKITKVINFWTTKYYLLYLNSEFVISSHTENYITMPFGRKQIYLNFLLKRKFVFLQHGVSIGNLAPLIDKPVRNIDLFLTSSEEEYKNLLKYYIYDENVIKLTGMPRYDMLNKNQKNKKEKIILFYPTWRNEISGPGFPRKQGRPYRKDYINSEYFKFFNDVLKNEKLLKKLKEKKYKIIYCLHPLLKEQLIDHESNDVIEYVNKINYNEMLNKASLMVTDYSSLAFDFAYLKKPVIYAQFDKDTFFKEHIYFKDIYFDFIKDGFGEVKYDSQGVVNQIIKNIDTDCVMDKKYVNKVEKFFKFKDNKNSERVYKEIIKLRK